MSCSSFDIKAYFLGELAQIDRARIQDHVAGCQACHDEWERLALTRESLLALHEEEVPRKIAFVSDKIFEPNWWQRLWTSGARLGFASAALLATAILLHGFLLRPPASLPVVANVPQPVAQLDASRIQKEVDIRIQSAVTRAVAESEARQSRKTADLLAAAGKKYELDRKALLLAAADNYNFLYKQVARMLTPIASNSTGEARVPQ